jgi:hypothetical protein
MEVRDRAGAGSWVRVPGRSFSRRADRGGAAARACVQPLVRFLPRFDAVLELRRRAGQRSSGAGAGGSCHRVGQGREDRAAGDAQPHVVSGGSPVSHWKITVVRDLVPGDPTRVWDSLRAKVRSQVRRPQKEGITVRFGLDQVGPFFQVFSEHMRDLGTPTQPRRLFDALAETFPGDVWFGCAYDGERPIAAGCGFRWNREFEMTWAAALSQYNAIAPNMLLYWAFIERRRSRGSRSSISAAARRAAARIGSSNSGAGGTCRSGGISTRPGRGRRPHRPTTGRSRGVRGSGSACRFRSPTCLGLTWCA